MPRIALQVHCTITRREFTTTHRSCDRQPTTGCQRVIGTTSSHHSVHRIETCIIQCTAVPCIQRIVSISKYASTTSTTQQQPQPHTACACNGNAICIEYTGANDRHRSSTSFWIYSSRRIGNRSLRGTWYDCRRALQDSRGRQTSSRSFAAG
jgi:hypothetical protein